MSTRPWTVNLYVALAIATTISWTILRYDEVMARLSVAIVQSAVGAVVLWAVWRGNRAAWLLVVVLNALVLVWTTGAWLAGGPPIETAAMFALGAAKLILLLRADTRKWVGRPSFLEAT